MAQEMLCDFCGLLPSAGMLAQPLLGMLASGNPPAIHTKQPIEKTIMKTTIENINAAIRFAGAYPFRHESGYPDYNAERNLSGRTHFADPQTLKYFKSRILDSGMTDDKLVFWLIESNRSKPFECEKNKRFVAFDVFGTQVFERDSWHKTSKAAYKEGKDWLASFDAIAHTEKALRAKASRDAENAKSILESLA